MRIGDLAARTEVPVRLLRYYGDQGLLSPGRSANGYRDYEPDDVPRVLQIRGLIDAGVPTAIIREILPCLEDPATSSAWSATATPSPATWPPSRPGPPAASAEAQRAPGAHSVDIRLLVLSTHGVYPSWRTRSLAVNEPM